jgi:hypothetical protein
MRAVINWFYNSFTLSTGNLMALRNNLRMTGILHSLPPEGRAQFTDVTHATERTSIILLERPIQRNRAEILALVLALELLGPVNQPVF